MINLPDPPGPPAVAHKCLRERHRLGHLVAEMPVEIVHLDGVRPQPGHHAGARGIAERQLIVRAIKPHAARRQPVNVRRLGDEIAITPQRRCEVIDGDKQHIGLGRQSQVRQQHEQENGEGTHRTKHPVPPRDWRCFSLGQALGCSCALGQAH